MHLFHKLWSIIIFLYKNCQRKSERCKIIVRITLLVLHIIFLRKTLSRVNYITFTSTEQINRTHGLILFFDKYNVELQYLITRVCTIKLLKCSFHTNPVVVIHCGSISIVAMILFKHKFQTTFTIIKDI